MSATAIPRPGGRGAVLLAALRRTGDHRLVVLAIAAVVALQVVMIFTQGFNWDEFFHFSQIYELHRGELTRDYQVLHARVFAWVPLTGGDVVDQLLVARLGMLGFELIAFFAVVGLAKEFTDERGAWLAGLAWIGGGYVFMHGYSFRGDPMATAGLMTALYVLGRRRLGWLSIGLIALSVAFAFMANMKSVLYAPCFAGIAWLRFARCEDRFDLLRRYAVIAVLTPLCFAAMYFLHRAGLPAAEAAGGHLPRGGSRFFAEGLFPRGVYTVNQLRNAPLLPLALLLALWVTWRAGHASAKLIAIAGLLVPALAVVIYRNSFPYFFAFALAPFAVAAAPGFGWLNRQLGSAVVAIALLITPIVLTLTEPQYLLPRQRAIIAEVNRLFPDKPLHLSYSGMPADYPRVVNHLISGIGIETYYRLGRPRIAEQADAGNLAFVISDNTRITAALEGRPVPRTLLPEDVAALHGNFVRFWGPIWLPGKRIDGAGTIEVRRPGPFTLGGSAIELDGRRIEPGTTLVLSAGTFHVVPLGTEPATLWRGNRVPVPPARPLKAPYYPGFR